MDREQYYERLILAMVLGGLAFMAIIAGVTTVALESQ